MKDDLAYNTLSRLIRNIKYSKFVLNVNRFNDK